jgi:hypothetical protein
MCKEKEKRRRGELWRRFGREERSRKFEEDDQG